MSRLFLFGAASLAALGFAACGNNTDTTAMNTPAETPAAMETASANNADNMAKEAQDFVNNAGQANLVEIRTSEMALEKSTNADVKAFAQKMIDDHKAALDKIKATASSASLMAPPEALDDFHMRRINDLTETDGDADFDADYAALQVDAHNDAIKLFEDYSRDSDATPELKALADEMLPALNEHKTMAETLRDNVNKAPGATNPS